MPRDTLIQIRRGTLAQWLSTNPTLANGEIGFITDQCRLVVGKDEVNFSGLWYSDSCVIPQTGITAGVGGGTISNAFRFVNISGSKSHGQWRGYFNLLVAIELICGCFWYGHYYL